MSKELEALDKIGKAILKSCSERVEGNVYFAFQEEMNIIEKQLKALEIIKKKGVNIYFLEETDNANEYNELIKSHLGMKALTQEEYDLLKEVLL